MSEASELEEGRVDLHYELDIYGMTEALSLPFVIGVVADLGGRSDREPAPLVDRRFLEIDSENFDARLKALEPRVAFKVDNALSGQAEFPVNITFETLEDFSPVGVARRLERTWRLLQVREQLSTLVAYVGSKPRARALVEEALTDPNLLGSLSEMSGAAEQDEHESAASEYARRMAQALPPMTERARELVNLGLHALATHVAPGLASSMPRGLAAVEATVSRIDELLAKQMQRILHHEDFRRLEAAWRGLDYLVRQAAAEDVRVYVLAASPYELRQDVQQTKEALLRKCMEQHTIFGGQPFGLLVVDGYFWHHENDVDLLGAVAEVAETALVPVIAGAAPALLECDDLGELRHRRRLLDLFRTPPHAPWRKLRQRPAARYLGLVLPRVLGRELHLEPGILPDVFRFEERATDLEDWPWINPAFVLAGQLAQAHIRCGWFGGVGTPEIGGLVEDLPTWDHVTAESEPEFCCPTETSLRAETVDQLEALGLIALRRREGTDAAYLSSLPSLNEPREARHQPPLESAGLTVMFVLCHVARYLSCILRDKIGALRDEHDALALLNGWLAQYTKLTADGAEAHPTSRRPLQYGEVGVDWVAVGDEGAFERRFTAWLQPSFQMTRPVPPIPIRVPLSWEDRKK